MKEIKIDSLQLVSRDGTLQLKQSAQEDMDVTLDQDQVRELIAFAQDTIQTELNERRAHRVNVRSSSNLRVSVLRDGQRHRATARNLSYTGAMIDLHADSGLGALHVGDEFELELALDGEEVRLSAKVVRRVGSAYGLHFPACVRNEKPDPPGSLMRIVDTLQEHFDRGMELLEA